MVVPEMDCGHCGFTGGLDKRGHVVAETNSQETNLGELTWTRYWNLYRCPACSEPTLAAIWWSDELSDPEDDREDVIYPTARDNSVVPERVRKRLTAANRVKMIEPGLYAVGIRRMLETICNEEGATGNTLFDKLDDLAKKGRVPGTLSKIGDQLRKHGNLGAHDGDVDLADDDVPLIEDFADAILEYLYRAPQKVEAAEASLKERQAKASAS